MALDGTHTCASTCKQAHMTHEHQTHSLSISLNLSLSLNEGWSLHTPQGKGCRVHLSGWGTSVVSA